MKLGVRKDEPYPIKDKGERISAVILNYIGITETDMFGERDGISS